MRTTLVLSLLLPVAFAFPQSPNTANIFAPRNQLSKRHPPPPLPDNDPWYAAPNGLEDAKPGDILKWRPGRPLSLDNQYMLNGPKHTTYQIQYRTQDAKGKAIANVLTAVVPQNAQTKHLFTYIYFSDTPSPHYNPSLDMVLRTGYPVVWTKQQLGGVVSALEQGWIVAVPDDNGPQASFPSGPTTAYTTIDSMRAMLQSKDITGLDSDAIITLNGYSGGGITSAWVAELHPIYAPELKIAGIATGGLVPDFGYLSNVIRARKGYNAWGVVVFVGLSHDYPELSTWLDDNLKPQFAGDFWRAENFSIADISKTYTDIVTCDYFIRGCDAWDDDIPSSVLREATLNGQHAIPTVPLYVYSTANDEISPIQMTRDLLKKWCDGGANILYEETPLPLTHATESVINFPGALQWMKERHQGRPVVPGCSTVPISMQSIMSGWPFSITDPVSKLLVAQYDEALRPNAPTNPAQPNADPQAQFNVLGTIINTITTIIFG